MKLRTGINLTLILSAVLFMVTATVVAQPRNRSRVDSAQLRSAFIAAFGKDFNLVKDEFSSRPPESGGGDFWLAYVKPIHIGHFALQYRFKYNEKLYSHVEHETHFSVGPQGCRRGPPNSGVYGRFCLGDTVIIPVLVERFTEHEFKLTKAQPLTEDKMWQPFHEKYPEARDRALDKTPVENSSESLRYVGRGSHKMFHRAPGYTLQLLAEFEAVKPGKFNLLVSTSPQTVASGKTPAGSMPIIVVARDTPVTLIAGREEVRGFTMGFDGREYVSSTSGNSYMSNLMILRPGDRISVRYLSVVRRGRDEFTRTSSGLPDPAESIKPVISVHPFALDAKYDYTSWLVDSLP